MLRRVIVAAVSCGVLASLTDCASTSAPAPQSAKAILERAIISTIASPSFTVWIQDHPASSSPTPTIEDQFVIQMPDRMSKDGTTIAIGSTGYSEGGGVWTTYHHPSLAYDFIDSALLYVRLLAVAKQVRRQASEYVVTGNDANQLLRGTHLVQYQNVSGAWFSATIRSGQLREEVVRMANPEKVITIIFSDVGSSPAVTAPPHISG